MTHTTYIHTCVTDRPAQTHNNNNNSFSVRATQTTTTGR